MNEKFVLNETVINTPFSGIRKFFDVANEIGDCVSLGVGEPDFQTPLNIRETAIHYLKEGNTKYTSNSGMLELRQCISDYLKKYDLTYDYKTEVLVTVGASEPIDISLRAMINPGDEVLLCEPCFVSYRPCIAMAGGIPVSVETKIENNFRLTPEDLEGKISSKTKVLLMSFPNNPTGAIMAREDLQKIADIALKHNIFIISDEVYSELTYSDSAHVSIASLPGMYDNCLVINGFSKAYAMTGWRLGYVAGPAYIISQLTKIHQYILMCASTNAQYAGIEAMKNSEDSIKMMREEYNKRRVLMLNGFRSMGLDCFEPLGAFYIFPSIQKTGMTSDDFCMALLNEERLAVVPGSAFGASGEGFVRCSYAYSTESLKIALERFEKYINKF